jgi:hypothetical protein
VRVLLLRLLLKSLQWFFDARIEELRGPGYQPRQGPTNPLPPQGGSATIPPPTAEMVLKAVDSGRRALLELQLRRLDCYLAVALGNDACQDPFTGHIHRHPNATWIS